MKPDENFVGLVRGYVIYSRNAGRISMEDAKDENNLNVGVAYTMWHRHDENPEAVMHEMEKLTECYMRMHGCDGVLRGFEYREYKH